MIEDEPDTVSRTSPRNASNRTFDAARLDLGGCELGGANFSGCNTADTRHNGLPTTTFRKPLGAGERWHKSSNGYPADDRLRKPHPVPRTTSTALQVRELQASVSPTPFVIDPGAASGDCIAILRLASLHLKSPD